MDVIWVAIIIFLITALLILCIIQGKRRLVRLEKRLDDGLSNLLNDVKIEYEQAMHCCNIPHGCKKMSIISTENSGGLSVFCGKYFVWTKEGLFLLFPCNCQLDAIEKIVRDDYWKRMNKSDAITDQTATEAEKIRNTLHFEVATIPIGDITFFCEEGEIYRETKIEGGGGGGISVTGAFIGGAVAGDVGALLGGRKPINEIKSELVEHDERKTVLYYKLKGQKCSLSFLKGDFTTLIDLIPEKERAIVEALHKNKLVDKAIKDDTISILNQIERLATLKDKGILTNKEYDDKKRVLLEKIQ